MKILIDHKLRIARSALPPEILHLIVDALTIPNVQRENAMKQGLRDWQSMPESIALWHWENRDRGGWLEDFDLVMPRGFLQNLISGLKELGIEYELEDNRVFDDDLPSMGDPISLRPWQIPAVEAILQFEQGIWKAPAGSGKTVGVLGAIQRLNCSSIVVVNTKDILYQWRDRAKQFLGENYPVGLIGDGSFEISDYLTIATVQTLGSRYKDLVSNEFFDQFSFFCLDECHHATATTYNTIVGSFSCRYRIGVSATPDKTGDFALAENVLGPIFHETKRANVNTIVRPVIFKIPTSFVFGYRGKMGHIPSNYPQLIQRIINDTWRNYLIAKSIMLERQGHCLIVSKRLEHLKNLADELDRQGYPHMIMRLTGQEDSIARKHVIEYASEYPCAIFSTLADEALDISRLDRLFLPFPQRNSGLIEQQVGRIARQADGKTDAKVFDFADVNVGPLEAQWRARRLEVYMPNDFEIITVNPDDILKFDFDEWDESDGDGL